MTWLFSRLQHIPRSQGGHWCTRHLFMLLQGLHTTRSGCGRAVPSSFVLQNLGALSAIYSSWPAGRQITARCMHYSVQLQTSHTETIYEIALTWRWSHLPWIQPFCPERFVSTASASPSHLASMALSLINTMVQCCGGERRNKGGRQIDMLRSGLHTYVRGSSFVAIQCYSCKCSCHKFDSKFASLSIIRSLTCPSCTLDQVYDIYAASETCTSAAYSDATW